MVDNLTYYVSLARYRMFGAPVYDGSIYEEAGQEQDQLEAHPAYHCSSPRILAQRVVPPPPDTVKILQLHDRPYVARIEGVFSPEECEALRTFAEPYLQPSGVLIPVGPLRKLVRDSSTAQFTDPASHTSLLRDANLRMAQVANCRNDEAEPVQITHYDTGGYFRPHFDFLPNHSVAKVSSQRSRTLIAGLNTPERGGATCFPTLKLTVDSKEGDGLYFEYQDRHGAVDWHTMHEGTTVYAGEKYLAQRFIHDAPVSYWQPKAKSRSH